jgi:hypothetical protein
MDTRAGSLLKHLGLIGSGGGFTGSLIPRATTPDLDQRLWREFSEAGQISDPELWTKFNSVLQRPTTLDAMFNLWNEMSQWDLLAAALVEIVEEATQADATCPGVLWYECNDGEFQDELNDMLQRLDVESLLPSQVWYLAALGNHFEKLDYSPGEGVIGMSFVHPLDVRRYWLERNRKCIGFRWRGHIPNKDDVFVAPDNQTPIPRVGLALDGNQRTVEDLWYPWDFLHFRRMYRLRINEHGEPIFAEADGIYKKLRLAIDQMVICRLQIQPDRLHVTVDTQDQPPMEQIKTVNRWRQMLRKRLAFGPGSGRDEFSSVTEFSSYYNALALDSVLFVAQPKGFNHVIGKIQGTSDIPDVYDIELLTELFYSILGMPKSWFMSRGLAGGDSGGGGEVPSGRALLAQDIRFLRKIKSLRKPVIETYKWLGYFHALLKGKDLSKLDIQAKMPPVGSLEDQMKLEMVGMQADILLKLSEVMNQYGLPKEAWIELIFKKYLHLPDDIVQIFMTALPQEVEQKGMGLESLAKNKKPAPATAKLLNEVETLLKRTPEGDKKVRLLREIILGKAMPKNSEAGRWNSARLLGLPEIRENDFIISSFGRHPLEFKRDTPQTESLQGTGRTFAAVVKSYINEKPAFAEEKTNGNSVTESKTDSDNNKRSRVYDVYRELKEKMPDRI